MSGCVDRRQFLASTRPDIRKGVIESASLRPPRMIYADRMEHVSIGYTRYDRIHRPFWL